jgi:hypothetical protein
MFMGLCLCTIGAIFNGTHKTHRPVSATRFAIDRVVVVAVFDRPLRQRLMQVTPELALR